jgi:transposase
MDGKSFRLNVEKVLLPTPRPGDIVIMDNLGSHRGRTVGQLIRSAGAKLIP